MLQKERFFKQSKSYDIEVKFKDLDLSNEIISLRVLSSIHTPYMIFVLDLFIDSNDIILEKLYGKDPLKIKIRLLGQEGIQKEDLDFELMYVKSDFKFVNKMKLSTNKQIDRTPIKIYCVPRNEFKIASKNINIVFEGKTIKEILQDLSQKAGGMLKIDEDGINKEKIDQIIIPPMSFVKSVKYLNDMFGIYDEPYQMSIEEKNKIKILNLSKQMNKSQTFTIYHLTNDKDDRKIIEKCNDGKNFYTYDVLKSNYSANTKFPLLGNTIKHITKPTDKLYHIIEQNIKDVCSNHGLISKNKDFPFDPNLSERVKYYTNHTGYETSKTFANSMVSKFISSMATLTFRIERNLLIENLLNTGEAVKFNTGTVEYSDLSGKYILRSTELILTKGQTQDWTSVAKVNLMRTNKTS